MIKDLEFLKPSATIILFSSEDIILTSGDEEDEDDLGGTSIGGIH